jgi:hypothetical protein
LVEGVREKSIQRGQQRSLERQWYNYSNVIAEEKGENDEDKSCGAGVEAGAG